jgi:hypothetical protein
LLKEVPDAPANFTSVFMKSQVIRKSEKWFSPEAKPGQAVTVFPAWKTFRDNSFAAALEQVVLAECPDHIYLHLRRSTHDLSSWVGKHMRTTESFTETDYTSWDSSVDGPFIKFDCWLLHQMGAPAEYIASYQEEACSTRFFRGNLRLMQHSGNRYTFLLNTLRVLALTQATYQRLRFVPQAYGGDDSLIAGTPSVSPGFRPSSWLCSPKVNHTSVGHLFGHLVSHGMLSYDYHYMANRLEVAIVERPFDTDFYRSFIDQMVALPYVSDPQYARVFDVLHSHVASHGLRIVGLAPPGDFELSFTPHSVFSNGVFPFSRRPRRFSTE